MIGATMVHQIAGSQVSTLVVRIRLESLQLTVGKFNSGCGTSPRVPDLLQCASLEPPSRHVVRRSVRNAAIRRRGKSDIKSLSG
jgi:hypothetical protein